MPLILVTDAWVGKSLSAIRSLGQAGYTVHAVSHTYNSFGFYSKYTQKYVKLPNPAEKPEEYKAQLLTLLAKNKYDAIIPMEDAVIKIILDEREAVEKLTHVALPLRENYYSAYYKMETLMLAESIGVPVPKTLYSPSVEELRGNDELAFPLIIKPVAGSGSRGLKKVHTKEELLKFYPDIVRHYGACVVQEALPQEGKGLGVGLIAKDGEVLCSYTYTRLREFPVTGGPGTLREVTNDQETQAYAAKLMHSLNWTGVAMVEFKTDVRTGKPKLMEINPRFWGSLELARYSGINLPKMLVQLSLGEEVKPQTAKVGTRARWLIPGDIAHFVFNPKRFSMKPSFFNFWAKGTYNDHLQWADFKGTLAFLTCSFLQFFDPKIWKMAIFRK